MNLTPENFSLYAMKFYDNPNCSGLKEFNDDLKKFQYIQKILKKRKNNKKINIKLTLNHIIVLYNLFGSRATDMLFYKIDKRYWSELKAFIVFLNFLPETTYSCQFFDDISNTNISEDLYQELLGI